MLLTQIFPLQSRFAPIPMGVHIAFCVLATILFAVLFIRQKKLSDFLWIIVCDLPIILQWYGNAVTAYFILACEIILLGLIFWEWLKDRKKNIAEAKALEETETADEAKEQE